MSGGQWDYFHIRFISDLDSFCNDIKQRFPELSRVLIEKGQVIADIIHDIDYDVCDDRKIEYDSEFEKESIKKLKEKD